MLKAVIFDMDGVIIDSEPIHKKVCERLCKKLGFEITDGEYEEFIGVSNTSMWTALKKKHNLIVSIEELVENQVRANLEELGSGNEKPMPGVVELLEELMDCKIQMGLASSSPVEGIELVLEKFKIKKYFNTILSGENLQKGKPDPDIFLKTSELLKVSPDKCIVIEDSKHGVTAAKAAGMICVGFRNINSGTQDLSKADIIIDSLERLNVKILKGLI